MAGIEKLREFQPAEIASIAGVCRDHTELSSSRCNRMVAEFVTGSDEARMWPDGAGEGVSVEIAQISEGFRRAAPDLKFSFKYSSFTAGDRADGAACAAEFVIQILNCRHDIVGVLKNTHTAFEEDVNGENKA